jgi:hypothetical protein
MWAVVAVAFVVVMVLGWVGFAEYQQDHPLAEPHSSPWYLSLQLFVLESGAIDGSLTWELHVARLAAPLVAAYAIVQALAAVFRDQMEAYRLRFVRHHVVVAGLGAKGTRLARSLLRRGDRVVVIEADSVNTDVDLIRALGGLVVVGDARDLETQRRARVPEAGNLVSLCGDDGVNVEVATRARELATGRRAGRLRCTVDLVSPELSLLLATEELERYGQAPVRIDFVNTCAAAAQALLRSHPPFRSLGTDGSSSPVLIVGDGRTARHLVLAIARSWGLQRTCDPTERLPMGLVGPDAERLTQAQDAHPELCRFAELEAFRDARTAAAARAPSMVFVCPDDDAAATATALDLRTVLRGRRIEIVVVLQRSAGLGGLLDSAPEPAGGPTMATFGMLDVTSEPDVLLGGTTELLARALHRIYLAAHAGEAAADDPALREWSELPELLRESNRDQAAHIAVKLAKVHRTVGQLTDWDVALRPFSDEEVEEMARLEHDRWVDERRAAGWTPGPRDPLVRTSPYLVPWDDLSEEVRDHDRMFVRELPRILAAVGLQAVPVDGTGLMTAGGLGDEATA